MEEVFQQIGRLVYEADQHGLWTNTGIRIQLGWSPFAIYGVHATDDRGASIGAGANPLTDKAIEIRQLLKSLDASPPEKHKCCGKCWIVEDELSFSIAADGRVEVGAYSEDGMPVKGVAMISKPQMEALALFLQGYARL